MIRLDGVRFDDANMGAFFARELESIEPRLYEIKKRELKARMHIPVSNRDNPGAQTITYRIFDKVGMAKILANFADDLPRADVFGKEYTAKVRVLATSFGYSTEELRAAMFANRPLDAMKADAARRAMRELENTIAWTGDSNNELIGLLNHPNITTVAAPAGVGGTTWALKTADEILADIRLAITTIRTASKGIFNPDTMLIPQAQYDIIAMKPRSSTSDLTILEFIQKPGNSFGLSIIDWLSTELDNAFTLGTEDGAVFYEKTPEVLELRIPMEMMIHPVQQKNLEYTVPVEGKNAGVVVRYPIAACYLTGI